MSWASFSATLLLNHGSIAHLADGALHDAAPVCDWAQSCRREIATSSTYITLLLVMGEVLTYRQISFDRAHIAPRQLVKPRFFEAAGYPWLDGSTRITELDEKSLIRWLMFSPEARHVIFEELGLPSTTFYRPEVIQPFYAAGEGDLDLVLCPPTSPNVGYGVECKRVKVETVNAGQDRINKLQDVAYGVCQANRLYDGCFAFHQTYLAILTEVTGAGQDEINIPNRGVRAHTSPQRGDTGRTTFRQIVEFPGRDALHKDIGILFIEIVQPSHISIDKQATVRVCIYRRAEPREQRDGVTNRIREMMG